MCVCVYVNMKTILASFVHNTRILISKQLTDYSHYSQAITSSQTLNILVVTLVYKHLLRVGDRSSLFPSHSTTFIGLF